jgi:AcrR family transcriptional regulator
VVLAGEDLADDVGLSRVTLAALAERLGVRLPSLYKHVDGMDGLQRGISVRAKSELGEVLARSAVGRARGDAIVAMSHAYRRWAREHPGRYSATQRAPASDDLADQEASLAVARVVFDVLRGYDLHDDDAVDATRALRSALHGFVSLEAADGFGLPVDLDRSFERLVAGLVTALEGWATAVR